MSEQDISEKCDRLRAAVDEFAKFLFLSIPRNKHHHLELLADDYGTDLAAIRHRPLMRTLMPRHIWEVVLGSARQQLLDISAGNINFIKWEAMIGDALREMQTGGMDRRLKQGWEPHYFYSVYPRDANGSQTLFNLVKGFAPGERARSGSVTRY